MLFRSEDPHPVLIQDDLTMTYEEEERGEEQRGRRRRRRGSVSGVERGSRWREEGGE